MTPEPTRPLPDAATITRLTGDWQAAPTLARGEKPLPPPDPYAVPGYELYEEIGRGGMGVVYKAKHIKLNRDVALKMVLSGAHAGATERARFRAEAEAVAQLQHPNVVQVYDVGEAAGLPYLSLEICATSLQQKLDGNPWPPTQAAKLIATLARAVQAAHTAGVIHRDLKPGNVLLTLDGTPKLTDFGLAKKMSDSGGPTATGAVLGTPSYMAPEQASGTIHAGDRGPRIFGPPTDVYALGAILYELLTGRPPFHGSSPLETLMQVTRDEPTPPSKLVPKIPRDLQTICLKCLEKEPGHRYSTAAELADDIQRYLRSEPIVARPAPAWERGLKWARRRPASAALVAVCLAAFVTLGSLGWIFRDKLRKERDAAMAAKDQAAASLELAKSEALKARRNNYLLAMGQAQLAWQQSAMTRLRTLLKQQEPKDGQDDLRGFEWHYWKRLSAGAPQVLIADDDTSPVTAIGYSPNGDWLVLARRSGRAEFWNAKTTSIERKITIGDRTLTSLVVGPQGRWVAFASLGQVAIVDAADGTIRNRLPIEGEATALAVRHSDGQLAVHHGERVFVGRVDLWDTVKGVRVRSITGQSGIAGPMAYSPDGRFLALGGFTVRLWDVATGEPFSKLPRGLIGSFSPDGRRLAIIERNPMNRGDDVRVVNVETGQQVYRCTGHTERIERAVFSPDGNYLATAGDDNTVRLWNAGNGQEERRFRGRSRWNIDIAFAPGSQILAAGTHTGAVELWPLEYQAEATTGRAHAAVASSLALHADSGRVAGAGAFSGTIDNLNPGRRVVHLKGNIRGASHAVFSRNGLLLAAAFPNGRITVWNSDTGQVVRQFRAAAPMIGALTFSGDGALLAAAARSFQPPGRPAPELSDRIAIWNITSGELKLEIAGEQAAEVNSVALSADGKKLLSGSGRLTYRLWDAETGRLIETLSERGNSRNWMTRVALSPDGRLAALAHASAANSSDPGIALVETETGALRATLEGHVRNVRVMAFSADGARLASASDDESIKLWDTATGQEVLSRVAPPNVIDLGLSQDGQKLIAVSQDGTTRIWQTDR